jgi:hypothetical protein
MTIPVSKRKVEDLQLIEEVIVGIDDIDITIPTASSDFGADLLKFLGTMSFVKPEFYGRLHLNICIYSDMNCTELIGREISSKNADDKPYF